jgi:5-methyltetrahydrofolate corrinoid/iron sulfur protein methyltransferase
MRLIADNLQMTLPPLDRAVDNRDPRPIRRRVSALEAAGAEAIDINTGPLGRTAVEQMAFIVDTVQQATALPLVVDTANPEAMAAGVRACRNPLVINGFSLEPQKLARILPLAVDRDADIVGYLLSPDGHLPRQMEDRLSLAVDLFQAATAAGLPKERLIIDPVVAPVAWEDGIARNRDLLSILRHLPELLGFEVRTLVGLSNLATGHPRRHQKICLEQAMVPMLAEAGVTMVMLNIFHTETVRIARTSRLLTGKNLFTWSSVPC